MRARILIVAVIVLIATVAFTLKTLTKGPLAFAGGRTRLYWGGRRKPAMAINGRRNKPFGPGGGTRRLHPSPVRPGLGGGETGSTRA